MLSPAPNTEFNPPQQVEAKEGYERELSQIEADIKALQRGDVILVVRD